MYSRNKVPCRYGARCTDDDCTYEHAVRAPCRYGSACSRPGCTFDHPNKKQLLVNSTLCRYGTSCTNQSCCYQHPGRAESTVNVNMIKSNTTRSQYCRHGSMCTNAHCRYRHRDLSYDDSAVVSSDEEENRNTIERVQSPFPNMCKWGVNCKNRSCTFRHPVTHEPKIAVDKLRNKKITELRSEANGGKVDYLLPFQDAHGHVNGSKKNRKQNIQSKLKQKKESLLKQTLQGSSIERSRQKFMNSINQQQIVLLTGASEFGRAICLPQYAANAIQGLVVCTYPRTFYVKQIAEKIALEFDKRPVGLNVGYRINGQTVAGRRIMLMTDAELILMAQEDEQLNSVSLLLINDAHERSLYTDIVLAVSKRLCKERAMAFKVVVCCAPMDMTHFSDFFFGPGVQCDILTVENQTLPVSVISRPAKESSKISTVVVDEIVTAMKKYTTGNCLVFMPSSRDVTKVIASLRVAANPDWVALPLTEDLTVKSLNNLLMFDHQNKNSRLIAVATDVAETYITVPNVQIVIDTGLVKKPHYDFKWRVTVENESYISQTNAEWRKNQAGRTSSGCYVRLYKLEDLPQKDVSPEILHSCLNLPLLQLFRLGYNPFELEFVDRPNENLMRSTVNLLMSLQCIDSNFTTTRRGALFSKVNLDPCISNFVMMALESYGQGEVASVIAAIINARPQSILVYSVIDRQQEVSQTVKFKSDLLYLYSLCKNWMKAGTCQTDSRFKCNLHPNTSATEAIANNDGCQECRAQYAKQTFLNDKVLNLIRVKVYQIREILFCNVEKNSASEQLPLDEMEDIIGRCLARSFPELVGEFLVPSNPTLGIRLLTADLRGKLAPSSVVMIPRPKSRFVIPLLISKLWTGQFILDMASHVELDWLAPDIQENVQRLTFDLVECYQRKNVSQRYMVKCSKYFESSVKDGDPNSQFVVCTYDSPVTTLTVYAPDFCADTIGRICKRQMTTWLQEDLECEDIKDCFDGLVQLTVSAGMTIKDVNLVGESVEIRFLAPPVENDKELLKWVCGMADLKSSDIKYYKYNTTSKNGERVITPYGTVVFRNKESASVVRKIKSSSEAVEQKSPGVCRVLVESLTESSIEDILALHEVFPLKVITKTPLTIQRRIMLENMSITFTESVLEEIIKIRNIPIPSSIQRNTKLNMCSFILDYRDDDDCSEALEKLQIATRRYTEKPTKSRLALNFSYTSHSSDLESNCVKKTIRTPAEYIIVLRKSCDGDKCYQIKNSQSLKVIDGSSCLLVENHEAYLLQSHSHAVAAKYGVKVKIGKETRTTKEVIFHGGLPSKCVKAVQTLRNIIAPIKHKFGDCEKLAMGRELHKLDKFQAWAVELGVVVEEYTIQDRLFGISIFGEKKRQGEFMRKMADYYTSFSDRYSLVKLQPSANTFFNQGTLGVALLSQIKKVGEAKNATVAFNSNLNVVEILVNAEIQQKPVSIIKDCKDAIKELLNPFLLETDKGSQSCVYCHESHGSPFFICGHNYCKDCLEFSIQSNICVMSVPALRRNDINDLEKTFALATCCPACNTKISVKDIASSLKKVTLNECLNAFAHLAMRKLDVPFALCPNLGCNRLWPSTTDGYAICSSCAKCVCAACGIVDDDRHTGRTCKEYQALRAGEVSIAELVKKAEDFARDHWKTHCSNQSGIVKVDPNPGLMNGCSALQLYCKAFKCLDLKDLDSNTIFGWHGTANDAISKICNDGFNPTLRRGQAYGPGEYFGTLAQISMGYAKNTQRLIVVQIIKAPGYFTERTGFCYVVNNPKDLSFTLCLPVVVVSYGSTKPPEIPWIATEKRPIPYPFGEITTTSENKSQKGTADATSWTAPFRWHWMTDHGKLEPYADSVNTALERFYESFKRDNGPSVVETDPIIRYVDDVPQVYKIDFKKSTQENARTKYVRKIERRAVVIPRSRALWKFLDEKGMRVPYDSLVQGNIESAYQDYVSGRGSSTIKVQFPGRPEDYNIDFVVGKQTNLTTLTMHNVTRELLTVP